MSGPIDLDVNLDTGEFTLTDSAPVAKSGRLSLAEIAEIKKLAVEGVTSGLESKACKAAELKGRFKPPNMDAMPEMTVTVGGRNYKAPLSITCWSEAAEKLRDSAYDASNKSAVNQ